LNAALSCASGHLSMTRLLCQTNASHFTNPALPGLTDVCRVGFTKLKLMSDTNLTLCGQS
jgi:hypothetical protein